MYTKMHLSSLPYLEPSILLLYPLNFFLFYIQQCPFCIPLCNISLTDFHCNSIIRDLHYFLLVLQRFILTLLPTSILMTPLLIPQNILCILLYSTYQSFSSRLNYLGIFYTLLYQAVITHLISLSTPVLFKISVIFS